MHPDQRRDWRGYRWTCADLTGAHPHPLATSVWVSSPGQLTHPRARGQSPLPPQPSTGSPRPKPSPKRRRAGSRSTGRSPSSAGILKLPCWGCTKVRTDTGYGLIEQTRLYLYEKFCCW